MKKHRVGVRVEKNNLVEVGDGLVRFPNKLVITDSSEQRNATRYDITSMDLSEYKGQVTADHNDMLQSIIAKVKGLTKSQNKVTIDAIQYAVNENPLARLAYNLLIGGYSTDFSIETYGEPRNNEGVYFGAKLIGLSQVVVGNNKSATLNQVVRNSIQQSKDDGLDVTELESAINAAEAEKDLGNQNNNNKEKETMFVTITNSRDFSVALKYKNAAGKEVELELAANATVDVSEDQKEALEAVIKNAVAPKVEVDVDAIVKQAVEAAVTPLKAQIEKVEQSRFDNGATEPSFIVQNGAPNGVRVEQNELKAMDWEERAVNQIESFRRLSKNGDQDASKTLRAINEFNLSELKREGMVKNALTIGDLGNYVISPEQLTEITGFRSDYSGIVGQFTFRDTLSTVTQWLKRSGDINMTHVDFDTTDILSDDYLKPVSSYAATLETMELEELAAVTPVANAATRFLAADILGDVNKGYRTDYERKLAQLIVGRLEQAVDGNGNSEIYNTNTDLASIKDFANVIGSVAQEVPNGMLIMNHKSYWQMVSRATGAGISGPLAELVTTGDQRRLFGQPVILVPNDLLPTLNTAETKTFVIDDANQTINHAVFYVNPSNFIGRTSGGLNYDLSTDAAYESGGTVRSAFQRNQIVLRGSFFRGGAVSDETQVAGLLSPGVS